MHMHFPEGSYLACLSSIVSSILKTWKPRDLNLTLKLLEKSFKSLLQWVLPSTEESWGASPQTEHSCLPPSSAPKHSLLSIWGWTRGCGAVWLMWSSGHIPIFWMLGFFDEKLKNEFPCALWELRLLLHFPSELRLWPSVKTSLPYVLCHWTAAFCLRLL